MFIKCHMLSNGRKCQLKVAFPSPFQYLNGTLSKTLNSLKVLFSRVKGEEVASQHIQTNT